MVYFLQDMRRDHIKIGYVDVMTVEVQRPQPVPGDLPQIPLCYG